MKLKRILKWSALALLLVLFAWFQFAYWTSTNNCTALIAAQGETMKAIVYCDFGPPDILRMETIAKPVPSDDQVLVQVRTVPGLLMTGTTSAAGRKGRFSPPPL